MWTEINLDEMRDVRWTKNETMSDPSDHLWLLLNLVILVNVQFTWIVLEQVWRIYGLVCCTYCYVSGDCCIHV